MKRKLLIAISLLCTGAYAQEHFAGISTSSRTGILNATVNPAELVNLKNGKEVNIFTFSANVANNKITFGDLVGGEDLGELIFTGDEPVNLRGDIDILGPSFAMKYNKWAFGVSTAAKIKVNIVDVNVNLGDALVNAATNAIVDSEDIAVGYNQRGGCCCLGRNRLFGCKRSF